MQLVEKAIKLKEELDTYRPLDPETEKRIMDKFRLDWNYHSNNLEGNRLTFGETKALLLHGITAQGKPLKDHFEITGHNEAINWVLEIVNKERPITENFIRELHKLLLKEPYEVDAITPDGKPTKKKIAIGEYKTTPNHVQTATGETFRFATPEETPAKIHDLLEWYKQQLDDPETNPILLAAVFHYRFILIHPFDDGNGRTVRILMNFILMQYGFPPVIIKTEDKENYFAALRQADGGDRQPFINYIAENLNHSLELMIKGAKGESIEEPDDLDKEIRMLDEQLRKKDKEIKIIKSKNVISQILEDQIYRFIEKQVKLGQKLDHYYLKSEFRYWVDNSGNTVGKDNGKFNLILIKNGIRQGLYGDQNPVTTIELEYIYKVFKKGGIRTFDRAMSFIFTFEQAYFKIEGKWSSLSITKFYDEQFEDKEMERLIQTEIREHIKFIKLQLAENNRG